MLNYVNRGGVILPTDFARSIVWKCGDTFDSHEFIEKVAKERPALYLMALSHFNIVLAVEIEDYSVRNHCTVWEAVRGHYEETKKADPTEASVEAGAITLLHREFSCLLAGNTSLFGIEKASDDHVSETVYGNMRPNKEWRKL